jgi:HD-GYP domain-containing protein (c-di-GMP phosphodiesterase class II)
LRSRLGELGLREPQASLVVPLGGEGGTLVLHRHEAGVFDKRELSLAARWGRLLGQALQRQRALERSQQRLVEITRAFVEAHEAQDFAQLGHARRVTAYALALGRVVGLGAAQLQDYFAAMLHDIGKLGAGDFSDDDEQHPQRGANLVASSPALEPAVAAIRAHHERWDGSGFPDGLMGTAIPLLARIVAVADCYDALSSERGQALPLREAEKKLAARAQRDLNPELVLLFVNILRRGKATVDLAELDGELLPFPVVRVPAAAP